MDRRLVSMTIKFAIGIPLIAYGLAGCGSSSHDSSPDPGGTQGARQAVIQYPNGFRNVAVQCWGPTAVFSASHGQNDGGVDNGIPGGVSIEPNSPYCKGVPVPPPPPGSN